MSLAAVKFYYLWNVDPKKVCVCLVQKFFFWPFFICTWFCHDDRLDVPFLYSQGRHQVKALLFPLSNQTARCQLHLDSVLSWLTDHAEDLVKVHDMNPNQCFLHWRESSHLLIHSPDVCNWFEQVGAKNAVQAFHVGGGILPSLHCLPWSVSAGNWNQEPRLVVGTATPMGNVRVFII